MKRICILCGALFQSSPLFRFDDYFILKICALKPYCPKCEEEFGFLKNNYSNHIQSKI